MIQLMTMMALLAGAAQADKQTDKKEAKWLTKYKEALQLAQKEGKPVVIDGSRAG
jgi:exonuclease III